ncbi:hypothetical protein V9T40_011742 [Parthenolecanium corni]|uniref:Uncharacterized protein n=1 Tax=Parthenolecanium corni TaxID=536013 RepID=A0AAN9T7M8_9HEMI
MTKFGKYHCQVQTANVIRHLAAKLGYSTDGERKNSVEQKRRDVESPESTNPRRRSEDESDESRDDRTGQNRTEQDRTEQDRTGQDMTGLDRTPTPT